MMPLLRWIKRCISDRSPIRLAWHHGKAFLSAIRFRFPARSMIVIGITGTDGKTTTVNMVAQILRHAGRTVAAASTALFRINDDVRLNETHLTSISPWALQRFLAEARREGCAYAVIEVSSHGLVQGRLDFTFPKVAAVTNVTPESLDYHKTMERYRKDKGKLFHMLRSDGTKVLNKADESFGEYESIARGTTVSYGSEDADMHGSDEYSDASSSGALLHVRGHEGTQLRLPVPGLYNLENAQCAICCCMAVGVPLSQCLEALASYTPAGGRMERIDEGQNFSVFVDFAMTENGYRKALQTLRSIVGEKGRVIVVYGCIGNRMKEKRRTIAETVSDLADIAVVTSDETYGEDPHAVHEETWSYINHRTVEAHKIFDRKEAIAFALQQAQPGDAVICCGMGPFTSFMTINGPIAWNEGEIIRELLRKK